MFVEYHEFRGSVIGGQDITLARSLIGTDYEQFDGRKISEPIKNSQKPSTKALAMKLDKFPVL